MYKRLRILSITISLLTIFGCADEGKTSAAGPKGNGSEASNGNSNTSTSTTGTGTTGTSTSTTGTGTSTGTVVYKWSDVALPKDVAITDVKALYMSNDKQNLYLNTKKGLWHAAVSAPRTWTKIDLSQVSVKTGATEFMIADNSIGDCLPTHTGLAVTQTGAKFKFALINKNEKKIWGINTNMHYKDAANKSDQLNNISIGQNTDVAPFNLVEKTGKEYILFAGSFVHPTADDFDKGPEAHGQKYKNKTPPTPFDTITINMDATNETKDDDSALTPGTLVNAYAIDADRQIILVKDVGLFIRTGTAAP